MLVMVRLFTSGLFIILCTLLLPKTIRAQIEVKDCSPVLKLTKYKVQKGDHIAAILRTLQLEPVFGANKSLSQLLKINNLVDPNLIEPGQELAVPFKCEEQIGLWQTEDRENDRLLFRRNQAFVSRAVPPTLPEVTPSEVKKVDTNSVAVLDTTNSIIQQNSPTEEIPRKNIDQSIDEVPVEISEALRYRMICDGEWTGTQCVTRYSTLFIDVSGWYNRYDGVDPSVTDNNQGVLLSRLNPELGAGWYNYWTENLKTELHASMQNSTLLPEAREIPLQQGKKFLGSFKASLRYELGSWGLGVFVRQYEKQFYRFSFSGLSQPCLGGGSSFSGCGVVVSTVAVTGSGIDLSYMIFQAGKFRYDFQVYYKQIGSASTAGYEILKGSGAGGIFRVSHDRVKEYIYAEISYAKESQNTTIEQQTMQNLGFTFGYAWKLKDW
jgi:LysM repeat protein